MRTSFKLWSVLAIGLACLATPLRAEFLYMTNEGGNNLSAYRIAENGALTLVVGSPFRAGSAPQSVAVDLLERFLYVANIGDNTISAYRIHRNGALTPLAGAAAGIEPVSVAVEPTGRFVYVSNLGNDFSPEPRSSNVSAYRIARNGTLTPVVGSPFPAGIFPIAVVVDPLGRFVYAANSGTQEIATENISGYRIGRNGALTPLLGSPFPNGEGPESAAVDPWGRFLYVSNFFDGVFSAYQIAANGALTPVVGSPFLTGPNSGSVVVDPLGRFVYVANLFDIVSGYRIAGNGALTPLPGSPFKIGFQPDSMVVDLSGRFLYMANGRNVSGYRIAGNGALTPLPGSPFLTGFSPSSMAVSP